jgi:hypothetical protein
MKIPTLIPFFLVCLLGLVSADERTPPRLAPGEVAALSSFARALPADRKPAAPVGALLGRLRDRGCVDQLPYLIEYGLRVHLRNLRGTGLSRELPLKSDPALTELVRLARIAPYTRAHEAGWLESQFLGRFRGRGHSSYQVWAWSLERASALRSGPNGARIERLLVAIRNTGRQGLGGEGVCHYGCR